LPRIWEENPLGIRGCGIFLGMKEDEVSTGNYLYLQWLTATGKGKNNI